MSDQADKLVKPGATVLIIILTLAFYAWMTQVCLAHTPSVSPKMQLVLAAFTAVPLAGTFWLSLELFRVTLVDQLRRKRKGLR